MLAPPEPGICSVLCASLIVVTLCILFHNPYQPLPLIGHAHAVIGRSQQDILQWMLQASRYFEGDSWWMEVPMVGKGWFVNDPATLKYVLSTAQQRFSKGRFFTERTRDLFGHGILIATGDSWRTQRNAGSALVGAANLDLFADHVLPGQLNVLLEPLTFAAGTQTPVDFSEIATDFSLAVFADVALQSDWETTRDHFSKPFIQASGRIADRFRIPFYWVFEAILPSGAKLRAELRAVHQHVREMVREARNDISEEQLGGARPAHGRGMLIRALLDTQMTEDEMADSCLNFLTAGVDTTAQALSWTIYLLICHPQYMVALRRGTVSDPSLLAAIISEALRLQPPIPLEILENASAAAVPLPNGRIVAPGEQVMWSPWVMARLAGLWDDPERFYPERWLDMKHKPSAYEWPVFHAGSRACLGQRLARTELAFALKELLERFDFEKAWDGEKGVGKGLTAPIEGGLPVRVRKR